jgi:CDP-diacylglycerol--serine O-phosphatidyltransferase
VKIKLFTLPNVITLLNLLAGLAGVIALSVGLRVVFWCIVAAAIFDFLDGMAARLTRSVSAVGVQLDSLADVVSFGVLPSLVAVYIYIIVGGSGYWGFVALIIALFSALRLAKFNVDDSQRSDFVGLPTPANALLIGSVGYWAAGSCGGFPPFAPWLVLAGSVLLAWLLISPVRMFSLKFSRFSFAGNEVRYCFLFAAAVLLAIFGLVGIALAIILYILTSLTIWLLRPTPRCDI